MSETPAGEHSADHDARVEAVAAAIYPDVMSTWEDQWPLWEYADEGQADFMRGLARTALAALEGSAETAEGSSDE